MNNDVSSTVQDAAKEFIALEAQSVHDVAEYLDSTFDAVVELFLKTTGKVFTAGSGTSGHAARRFAHLLSVSGTPAVYLQPMDALHGSMGALRSGDVLVALSKGGATAELIDLATRARTQGVTIVAVTFVETSELAAQADIHVRLRNVANADPGEVIAMGSTLVVGAWGDAVAYTLMRLRGYSWAEVLFTHPAGAVGHISETPDELPELKIDERGEGQ